MRRRLTPLVLADGVVIVAVWMVTLWALHPSLLLSSTTVTGGDTGAHVALAAYLKSHGLWHGLTPWYPGWFAGFPLYTFYFPLPDLIAALLSYVIPFTIAFKFATILGSLALPVGAYVLGRGFRAPRPIPAALAAATLPFLFDVTYTIDGGNLFSTLAGEYAFSLGLALALMAVGTFVRAIEQGRSRWLPAVLLALTMMAHVLTFLFAVVAIGLIWLLRIVERTDGVARRPRRRLTWSALGVALGAAGLMAWWLGPFLQFQRYTNSMGYTNNPVGSPAQIFAHLGWFCQPNLDGCPATSGPGADRVVIVLAAAGLLVAFYRRSRLGMFLSISAVLWLMAYIVDPQGIVWNERLVPFWYVSVYLTAGWLVGQIVMVVVNTVVAWTVATRRWWHRRADGDEPVSDEEIALDPPPSVALESVSPSEGRTFGATLAVAMLAVLITVTPLVPWLSALVGVNPGPNEVPNWAAWNYAGYEQKPAWPELHHLVTSLEDLTKNYGCGRAMWEYAGSGHVGDESRFGTTMALMLLPYWTNNCVGSMEGLLFESSATTPYHFLNQSELSAFPSDPMVGLAYAPLNVAEGVQHLQMLGVRYYLAFSPAAVAQADALSSLQPLETIPARADEPSSVAWHIYRVKDSPLVTGLSSLPNVVQDIGSRLRWLNANTSWWQTPTAWSVLLAQSGPPNWPHVTDTARAVRVPVPPVTITDVRDTGTTVGFHVSRVGVPVLVKVSYFPNWRVSGALGPFRVSPNLMAVVPTSTTVVLRYGTTGWGWCFLAISVLVAVAGWRSWRRRRRSRAHYAA